MTINRSKRQVRIGLVEVWPSRGSRVLEEDERAFVNVLAWSATQAEYRRRACELCDYYWLVAKSIGRSEPFYQKRMGRSARQEFTKLAEKVTRHRDARFGTFHIWVAKRKGK